MYASMILIEQKVDALGLIGSMAVSIKEKKHVCFYEKNKKEIFCLLADIDKINLFAFDRKVSPTIFLSGPKEEKQVVTILTETIWLVASFFFF